MSTIVAMSRATYTPIDYFLNLSLPDIKEWFDIISDVVKRENDHE